MSIESISQIKQFKVGIIISRNFDNLDLLEQTIGSNIQFISHIYSNAPMPGGKYLEDFCREQKIPLTVFPANPHTFSAISNVLQNSSFVYIITDGTSKAATTAEEFCKKDQVKYKIINYNPFSHWGQMIVKIKEILLEVGEEKVKEDEILKRIHNVIKK